MKTICFKIDAELFREIHMRAAKAGLSIQDYACGLIAEDLGLKSPRPELTEEQKEQIKEVAETLDDCIRRLAEIFELSEQQANTNHGDQSEPEPEADIESGLPPLLKKSIDEYLQGCAMEECLHLDCLADELIGSIDSCLWGGSITQEQADYLRRKYLDAPEISQECDERGEHLSQQQQT